MPEQYKIYLLEVDRSEVIKTWEFNDLPWELSDLIAAALDFQEQSGEERVDIYIRIKR